MMISVVTISAFHQRLLSILLSDLMDAAQVRVVSHDDEDGARPAARQKLMLRREPVVFVIDAGTVDARRVALHEHELNEYFNWGAGGLPFQVVQFVPEIEVIFFERPQVLERLLGRKLEEPLMIAGEVAPRAVLERLGYRQVLEERLDDLTCAELCQLRGQPAIAAIREFVVANAEPALARRSA